MPVESDILFIFTFKLYTQVYCLAVLSQICDFCILYPDTHLLAFFRFIGSHHTHTPTHNHFTAILDFVREYPGEPAPEM